MNNYEILVPYSGYEHVYFESPLSKEEIEELLKTQFHSIKDFIEAVKGESVTESSGDDEYYNEEEDCLIFTENGDYEFDSSLLAFKYYH